MYRTRKREFFLVNDWCGCVQDPVIGPVSDGSIDELSVQLGPGCLGVLDCSVGAVFEDTGAIASLECALLVSRA